MLSFLGGGSVQVPHVPSLSVNPNFLASSLTSVFSNIVKFVRSSLGVQVGACCEFLVSIH
jgi:hypothetical protein